MFKRTLCLSFKPPVNSGVVDETEILEHVNESSWTVSGFMVNNSRDTILLSILFDSINMKQTISLTFRLRYII